MLCRTGRYYLAVAVMVVLFVLNWNVWMAGAVYPIVLGMPVLYLYHAVYGIVSAIAYVFLFDTLWPAEPSWGRGDAG